MHQHGEMHILIFKNNRMSARLMLGHTGDK